MTFASITSIRNPASLNLALAHAITFLTRPLSAILPLPQLIVLQHALSSTLTPHFAASWHPAEPARGVGRRCLSLAPHCAPPRPIHLAAARAGVEWACWAAALGGREFDLLVDPGRVRVRVTGESQARLVWAAIPPTQDADDEHDVDAEIRTALRATMARAARARVASTLRLRTDLAAYVASDDDDESGSDSDSLFSAAGSASSRSSASSWSSPKSAKPTLVMPRIMLTPASPIKASTIPFPSVPEKIAPAPSAVSHKMSRRERARQRRAGIVTLPPVAPTVYDGGRTTVLGGGVRLGGTRSLTTTASA